MLAALPGHARSALAQTAETLRLLASHCTPATVDVGRVTELLGIELAPIRVVWTLLAADSFVTGGDLGLWLDPCTASDAISVGVVREHTVLEHAIHEIERVDLATVPPALRDRIVAMVLAERYRAARMKRSVRDDSENARRPTTTDAPATTSVEAAPTIEQPNAAHESTPTRRELAEDTRAPGLERTEDARAPVLAWNAGFVFRGFLRERTPLWGAAAGLQTGALQGALVAVANTRGDALGTATLGYVAASFAYDLYTFGTMPVVSLRPRAEIGAGFAAGRPEAVASGAAHVAMQAALYAELAVRVPVASSFSIELAVNAGLARGLIARSDAREIGATHGIVGGAQLVLAHGH